jgi:carbon starvation protein CstA
MLLICYLYDYVTHIDTSLRETRFLLKKVTDLLNCMSKKKNRYEICYYGMADKVTIVFRKASVVYASEGD